MSAPLGRCSLWLQPLSWHVWFLLTLFKGGCDGVRRQGLQTCQMPTPESSYGHFSLNTTHPGLQNCSENLTHMISIHSHNTLARGELWYLLPLWRWVNWGTERFRTLPRAAELKSRFLLGLHRASLSCRKHHHPLWLEVSPCVKQKRNATESFVHSFIHSLTDKTCVRHHPHSSRTALSQEWARGVKTCDH